MQFVSWCKHGVASISCVNTDPLKGMGAHQYSSWRQGPWRRQTEPRILWEGTQSSGQYLVEAKLQQSALVCFWLHSSTLLRKVGKLPRCPVVREISQGRVGREREKKKEMWVFHSTLLYFLKRFSFIFSFIF